MITRNKIQNTRACFWIFLAAISLDRITKIWAVRHVKIFKNYGVSFSMFNDSPLLGLFLSAAGLAVFAYVYMLLIRERPKLSRLWPSLFFAGSLGNLADRILYGYVIDWIDAAVFINIADIFICCAAAGMILDIFYDNKIIKTTDSK